MAACLVESNLLEFIKMAKFSFEGRALLFGSLEYKVHLRYTFGVIKHP